MCARARARMPVCAPWDGFRRLLGLIGRLAERVRRAELRLRVLLVRAWHLSRRLGENHAVIAREEKAAASIGFMSLCQTAYSDHVAQSSSRELHEMQL